MNNMVKKIIRLSKEQLVQKIKKTLYENLAYKIGGNEYPTVISHFNEMATMNSNDTSGAFPRNRCLVEIWPNDHEPKHIHVKRPGEFELTFFIDTGEYYQTKFSRGKVNIRGLTKSVKQWLSQPSSVEDAEGLTNRQMCKLQWNIYHPKK